MLGLKLNHVSKRGHSYTIIKFMAWITNYLHIKQKDVIIYPCLHFNEGLADALEVRGVGE